MAMRTSSNPVVTRRPGRPGAGPATPDYRLTGAWALVGKCRDGELEAFGEIYSRYRDDVMQYALSIVKNRAVAEDLVSETFARALASIHHVRYQGVDLRAWVMTIVRNMARDHLKSSYVRRRSMVDEVPEQWSAEADPERIAVYHYLAELMWQGFAELTGPQRTCLELRFGLELSVRETAHRMQKTEATVRQLQHRAVRALRARMIAEWGDEFPHRVSGV
ncbi:sigma-70 family RNA polymerase sigma factor [Amycolatopsis acidicola]|uniref:Sigma-70 family RNA polymerase sigma factor n=1 Tax=Amycolatopsis acidicola TaxID=2596893 RepID=A0A5N0V222_9PSEU|nr:sigma-70 family RNA polymerase sigma factor [Amycolatopsis acidicola]KAA9160477.1 sigma-70 family RNA polymerase sigma factor [Amycolatopsis acidicola]